MSNETCPHCGAEGKELRNIFRYEIRYDCGSIKRMKPDVEPVFRFRTANYCYKRQLATQAAEIERLKQEMSECRECSLRIMRGEVK